MFHLIFRQTLFERFFKLGTMHKYVMDSERYHPYDDQDV
jgi:hypothetical protein